MSRKKTPMTLTQIRKFVKRAAGWPISVRYGEFEHLENVASAVWDQEIELFPFIEVNKKSLPHLKEVTLKAALLHEIGHIAETMTDEHCRSDAEYVAQCWAICRAQVGGMKAIERRLNEMLFVDWAAAPWNEARVYRMASGIAKKYGILACDKGKD